MAIGSAMNEIQQDCYHEQSEVGTVLCGEVFVDESLRLKLYCIVQQEY